LLRRNALTAALLSLSIIAMEMTWTRLFSAEFFYTFAFLVLSLAVLGLGLGALAVHMIPALDRESRLGVWLLLCGLTAVAAPVGVFRLGLDFTTMFHDPAMAGRGLAAVLLLAGPYFWGGAALALVFKHGHRGITRLYMADLLGAALGVPVAVWAMNGLGTQTAAAWLAIPVLLAVVLAGGTRTRLASFLLIAAMFAVGLQATDLLRVDREERAPVSYLHWDAAAKLKIYDYDEENHGLEIDNAANTPLQRFDGNWDRPDSLRFEFAFDVSELIGRFADCSFLSLGAGGGGDVLQALQAGCTDVHAVEVVPHINWLMTEGHLAGFTGNIYNDPRVTVVTEDARAYVRRFENRFDVIYSLSSNTFAALTSGAFALAENYLFTTGAFRDYWRALTDDGFLMMEHQFYMPRLVSEVIAALEAEGIADPTAHFAVWHAPSMRRHVLLLSKQPLDAATRATAFGELPPEYAEEFFTLWPAAPGHEGNLIERVVLNGWRAEQDSSAIDLSPCGDDRPFVAQLGLWKNFTLAGLEKVRPYEFVGFPLAKLLVVMIALAVCVIVLPLTLLPLLRRGPRLRPAAWFYFFAIGVAFMAVEVLLIQQWSRLVGPSLHVLVAVLLALLLGSGVGARLAERIPPRLAFGGIVLWLVLDALALPLVVSLFGGWTLWPRVLVTVLLLLPLGVCMGVPFPRATLRVGELVDWGFAVNGAGSVLGSTLVLLLAFTQGFTVALLAAAAIYALAWGLYGLERAW
jgi:hypothetical protein